MVTGPQQQAALLDPVWAKVKPCVLRIENFGQPSGLAVLIDGDGYFLAHRSAVTTEPITGKLGDAEPLFLSIVSVDDQTQLVLLRADNWIHKGRSPAAVSMEPTLGSSLIVATTLGPVRGQFISDKMVGQMRPSLRYAPLSEIRLESSGAPVGGAIAFDLSGRLVGLLGATLTVDAEKAQDRNTAAGKTAVPTESLAGASAAGGGGLRGAAKQYAPQGLTVAYSLGPTVLKRVVDGFLSRDHKVNHPSAGLFFKKSTEPGALVEEVLSGSPAADAGIKVGDLVIEADGEPIRSPVDLAIQLFKQNVGDTMVLKVKRDGVEKTFSVKIGSQTAQG